MFLVGIIFSTSGPPESSDQPCLKYSHFLDSLVALMLESQRNVAQILQDKFSEMAAVEVCANIF